MEILARAEEVITVIPDNQRVVIRGKHLEHHFEEIYDGLLTTHVEFAIEIRVICDPVSAAIPNIIGSSSLGPRVVEHNHVHVRVASNSHHLPNIISGVYAEFIV